MTKLNDSQQVPRPLDMIDEEEDVPLSPNRYTQRTTDAVPADLSEKDSLNKEITRFRYRTGRKVLYISMAAMGIAVVADVIVGAFGLRNELIESSFEAFKLITMTVLGYIFGSDNSKS